MSSNIMKIHVKEKYKLLFKKKLTFAGSNKHALPENLLHCLEFGLNLYFGKIQIGKKTIQ